MFIRNAEDATTGLATGAKKNYARLGAETSNSSGVIVPKPILSQLGVEAGDDLDLSLDENRIVLAPGKQNPPSGWADAAKSLADTGDDALVWPEFGNVDDAQLKW